MISLACKIVCVTCWQPLDRVLLVEWPRGNREKEGQGSAAESYVEGELDILEDVTDGEGEKLGQGQSINSVRPGKQSNIHPKRREEPWQGARRASDLQSPAGELGLDSTLASIAIRGVYNLAVDNISQLVKDLFRHGCIRRTMARDSSGRGTRM